MIFDFISADTTPPSRKEINYVRHIIQGAQVGQKDRSRA